MRNTPKLQDTLEVFLEELEAFKNKLKSLENIPVALNQKIERLNNAKLKVDISEFERNKKSIQESLALSETEIKKMNDQFLLEMKETIDSNRSNKTTFYWALIICAFIAILSIYFTISSSMEITNLKEKNEKLEDFNRNLQDYLNQTKQAEEYNKWYSNQQ